MPAFISEKIGNFILTIVILIIFIVAIITFIVNINDYKNSKMDSMIKLSKALVLNAESVRNEMADRYNLDIFRKDLTDPKQVVATVPVVLAWQAAQREAERGGYIFKVPKNHPRNIKNSPDDFEKKALEELESGISEDYIQIDKSLNSVRYLKAIKLTKECLLCHGDPSSSQQIWGNDKGLDVTGIKMEDWKTGEVHGAFEVILSLNQMDAAVKKQFIKSLIITILIIFLSIILIRGIVRKFIEKPINNVVLVAKKISDGDLTEKIIITNNNELGKMSKILNDMVDNLSGMINNIKSMSKNMFEATAVVDGQINKVLAATEETTASIKETVVTMNEFNLNISSTTKNVESQNNLVTQTNDSTQNISFSVKRISENTNEMSKSVVQTSSAIEEMMRNISSITSNVSLVSEAADESGKTTETGKKSINSVISSMNEICNKMSELVKIMENLGMRAMNIDQIVGVIDEIAEQTNLLALNAAIEAARSGEHGKGFAVVAEEVRKLAERSSKSAKEISAIIKDIQNETNKAIISTKEGFDLASGGMTLSNDTGSILNAITEKFINMTSLIKQVNSAITEQNEGGNLILQEVEKLKQITGEITQAQGLQARSIEEIVLSMKNVANITKEINSAMNKQKNGADHINKSMEEINKASNFNLSSAEKVSEEINNLKNISENLSKLVSKFKIL
ncbi:DUF3365 domain-containing protein [Candidatus Dependentiae bacterium]|nr:DUF3365 domain-containing protein [Candidatus Dependentiae bacterium]